MTDYDAVMIAAGVFDPFGDTDEEKLASYHAAWQRLIDTGLCWELQGWFGRCAQHLIKEGVCSLPEKQTEDGNGGGKKGNPTGAP